MTTTPTPRNGSLPHDAHGFAPIYHQRQLSPIPVPYRSKDPGYRGWQTERIKPEDFERRFPAGEQKNIAVHNGAPSDGHHDVDLDCAEALAVGRMLLPPTGWVFGRTSTPDAHRIYKSERSFAKAHEKYRDVDGTCLVELRGTGGITIYPPSAHDETGEPIRWQTFTEPGELQLVDLERAVAEVAAATLLARHWPGSAWHDATLALAGGLLRGGMPQERVEQVIEAVWQTAGTDDKPSDRNGCVRTTAEKLEKGEQVQGWPKLIEHLGEQGSRVVSLVRKWLGMVPPISTAKPPARKPLVIPPYRPFPVEALPSPLRQYVEQAGAALGCDVAFVAVPALAVVAGQIGNVRTIRLKRDWTEPSVLWSVVIADSGTLKSPAYQKAVAYLFKLQKNLLAVYKQQLEQYEEDLRTWEAAKRKKDGKDGADPGEKPKPPTFERAVISDVTIEKLAEILEDNPRGVFIARDELAGWLGSFSRYKGKNGGSDLPLWLEANRAGPWLVDRKTGDRKHYYVPHAAVSVVGGVQPGTLARILTDDFLDAGLGARLLMAMPPKKAKCWTELEVDPDTERAYHALLDGVRALEFNQDEDGTTPHVLKLSPEAKAAWVAFYNGWARQQAAAEGEFAAALSKLEGTAPRLALLHHVVTHLGLQTSDLRPVSAASMEAGITLCRWFADEARRVYSLLAENEDQRDTRKLVEFIQARGGSIGVRQLQRANNRKYPAREHAEAALEALVQAGLGTWEERPTTDKGGHPTRVFFLCTTHDTTDTTHDDGDGGDDDGPPPPHDTTPDTTPQTPTIPSVSEGSVGCVMRRAEDEDTANGMVEAPADAKPASGGSVVQGEVVSCTSDLPPAGSGYCLVNTDAELATVCRALEESDLLVGLDTETTGLDPRTDRVRLLSLNLSTATASEERYTYLVDCFAADPTPLWGLLAEKEVIAHNAAFDVTFLSRMGFEPATVHCTMLLSQLVHAGELAVRHNLKDAVQRELGSTLDKAEQKSAWSGRLTAEQLEYAAHDAEVLVPLYRKLAEQIKAAKLEHAAGIERRALPALVWAGQAGCPFDRDAWTALAGRAELDRQTAEAELDRLAPSKPGNLHDGSWTWSSNPQVKDALKLIGHEVEDTGDATLAAIDHPLAAALRQYRDAAKRVSTYGADWLEHVAGDGRVYASWRQLRAASGRMSCSKPNLQQLPRGEYRRCVVAPPGRVFVKADYSQVELRIAAKVSGDSAMLAAYQQGEDLHTLTARKVLGIKEVTKEHRQIAKALNFGLLFGMGYRGFRTYAKTSYGVDLTEEQAKQYRDAFFLAYPKLAVWHRRTGIALDNAKGDTWETRTLADRRRLFSRSKKSGKLPYTEVLNTPVQGTGADGLKAALGLLWERRHQVPGAFPVLIVHDEIVLECDEDQAAGSVAPWLRQAMVQGMAPLIAPVPVEVEVKIAKTWGGD